MLKHRIRANRFMFELPPIGPLYEIRILFLELIAHNDYQVEHGGEVRLQGWKEYENVVISSTPTGSNHDSRSRIV